MEIKTKRDYEVYIQALEDIKANMSINLDIEIQKYKEIKKFID